jgi:hypothetical protein
MSLILNIHLVPIIREKKLFYHDSVCFSVLNLDLIVMFGPHPRIQHL